MVAALGFGTVGAALAIIFRSPVAALAIGVAWLLPAEAILSALWSNGQDWLPGQLLGNLVDGGSSSVSLARTGLTLVAYWAIIAVGTADAVLTTRCRHLAGELPVANGCRQRH